MSPDLTATTEDLDPLFDLGVHLSTPNRKVRITRLDPKSVENEFPNCDRVVLVTPTGRTCTNIATDYYPQPTNTATLRGIHTYGTSHTRINVTVPYKKRAMNIGYDICSDKKDTPIPQSTINKRGITLRGSAFKPRKK
jgi:hypothetical protein